MAYTDGLDHSGMLWRCVKISVVSISAIFVCGNAYAFEPFCPVSSDLMKFREDLLTEAVLQKTLEALKSGPPDVVALLERPSEADYLSITYLFNAVNIIEGFRLRSDVQHRQAILALERLGAGDSKKESRITEAKGAFDRAKKSLCSFLENAEYAR